MIGLLLNIFSIVCRCTALVKNWHQNYFMISNWGECWASSNYYAYDSIKASGKNSTACFGPTSSDTNCTDDGSFDCAAYEQYSYLYEIINPTGTFF